MAHIGQRPGMTSNYAKYIYEREGKSIVESPEGFATYSYIQGMCYIEDIFVLPEHRKSGIASKYADTIIAEAATKGCKQVFGSVVISAFECTKSLKVLLAYGFKLHSLNQNTIFLVKDI